MSAPFFQSIFLKTPRFYYYFYLKMPRFLYIIRQKMPRFFEIIKKSGISLKLKHLILPNLIMSESHPPNLNEFHFPDSFP